MYDAKPGPEPGSGSAESLGPAGPSDPARPARPGGPAVTRRVVVLGGAAAVTLGSGVAALVLTVTRDGAAGPASPRGGAAAPTGGSGHAAGGVELPAGLTPIAQLRGDSAAFDISGGPRRGTVPGRWRGAPSALPVPRSPTAASACSAPTSPACATSRPDPPSRSAPDQPSDRRAATDE